jgi:putative transposase
MAISWKFRHFLRSEPGQSISRILQSLNVSQTWRYNKRHHSSGYVWQGWFQNPVIQDDARLLVVPRYIRAKPLQTRMVADPAEYRWSSYQRTGYLVGELRMSAGC